LRERLFDPGILTDQSCVEDLSGRYPGRFLGSYENISDCIKSLPVDEVLFALPLVSNCELAGQIVGMCRQQGIAVTCHADLLDPRSQSLRSAPLTLVSLVDCANDGWGAFGKRLVDLVASTIALIVMLPLFVVVAIAIKLTSPGPIIFSQARLGIGKRNSRIFKFRTMVVNAESLMSQIEHLNEPDGPHFKLQKDPRITPIGGFLRKTSLDELPQFKNVFLGDMSLVGPRPIVMRDYRGISEDWHRRRFSVKPGITCLSQVSGRNAVSFDRWMELDREYIDRWSLGSTS
jgi:lipopolysaccharide/colanic/teichoic acid biosynthesis glycosyltransferase